MPRGSPGASPNQRRQIIAPGYCFFGFFGGGGGGGGGGGSYPSLFGVGAGLGVGFEGGASLPPVLAWLLILMERSNRERFGTAKQSRNATPTMNASPAAAFSKVVSQEYH